MLLFLTQYLDPESLANWAGSILHQPLITRNLFFTARATHVCNTTWWQCGVTQCDVHINKSSATIMLHLLHQVIQKIARTGAHSSAVGALGNSDQTLGSIANNYEVYHFLCASHDWMSVSSIWGKMSQSILPCRNTLTVANGIHTN